MCSFFLNQDAADIMPPRRKTFSAGTVPEEFSSDTLKRRSKFSWVKSNFMRRKGEKKILSGSQTDLNANRSSSNIITQAGVANLRPPDPLRKSVSLELLPTTTDSDESSQNLVLEGGSDDNFHGYLRLVLIPNRLGIKMCQALLKTVVATGLLSLVLQAIA